MKTKIISAILLMCLVFTLCVPTVSAGDELNTSASLSEFKFVKEDDYNARAIIDNEEISIRNCTEALTLTDIGASSLTEALTSVAKVRATEADDTIDLLSLYMITDEYMYFYEEETNTRNSCDTVLAVYDLSQFEDDGTYDRIKAAEISVVDSYQRQEHVNRGSSTSLTVNKGSITRGVARLNIRNSAINYIFATLTAPTVAQLQGVNNTTMQNYIYTGFTASAAVGNVTNTFESDIGFMVTCPTGTPVGLHPYWAFKKNKTQQINPNKTFTLVSTGQVLTNVNHYLLSTSSASRDLGLSLNRSVNGTVQASVTGIASYGNTTGNVKTVMTAIGFDSSTLGTISKWKLVNTLTPTNNYNNTDVAKSTALFKNITVNGNALSLSTCDAEVTSPSDIGHTVKNNYYLDTITFAIQKP